MKLVFAAFAILLAGTTNAQTDISALEEAAIKAAVARVSPSTVRIDTVGGLEKVDKVLIGTGPTTGVVVDPDGYIVSSAFNFIQKPTSILVTLPDGTRTAAEIVARDHSRKVVLLKVESNQKLPVPAPVPRDEMVPGQWSIAVGRTFAAEYPGVSVGIVSAVDRIWGKALQTDCKVSPANYGGPLVDIQGRVYGILLPLSPQATTETAGAEWYDSGIGFCVPLVDIFDSLEELKSGKDLHAGLLGITIRGKNVLSDPAIVASVPAGTPAAEAGLKSGDKIVEINGQPVERHSELKQVLGPLYAGATVNMRLLRDGKSVNAKATLTDRIEPYDLPFLGVLPLRTAGDPNDEEESHPLVVRHVYASSPADTAGIEAGDRLISLDGTKLESAAAWRELVANRRPEDTVTVVLERDGKERTLELVLGRQPELIPAKLPVAITPNKDADKNKVADENKDTEKTDKEAAEAKLVKIQIAEHANECVALLPADFSNDVPHGVVIWLAAPGQADDQQLKKRWAAACAEHDLIVLAPRSENQRRWNPTEIEFIRKTIDKVIQDYNIDELRIVAHGHQGGASMGFLVAFRNRAIVRGVAAVDSVIPRRMVIRANDPVERLAFYFSRPKDSKLGEKIDSEIERLRKFKYPVTVNEETEEAYLDADAITALARWIDTLDRI